MRPRFAPVPVLALAFLAVTAPDAGAQTGTYEFRLDLEPKGQDLLNRITAAMETNQGDVCENTAADVGKRVLEQRWRDVATEQAFDLVWEVTKDAIQAMFPGSFVVQAGAEAADAIKNAVQSYLNREGPGGLLRRTGSQVSDVVGGELGDRAGEATKWLPEGYLTSKTGGVAAQKSFEAATAGDPPPLVEFPVEHDQCGEVWVRHWVLTPPISGAGEPYAAKLRYQIAGDCEGRYPPRAQQRPYKLHEFQVDGRVDLDTRVTIDLTSFPRLVSHEVLVTYTVPDAGSRGAFDWEVYARCSGGTAPAAGVEPGAETGAVGGGGEPADGEPVEPARTPEEMAELICERRCRPAYRAYADADDDVTGTRRSVLRIQRQVRDARSEVDRAERERERYEEEIERLERERERAMARIDELGRDAPAPGGEGTLAERIADIDDRLERAPERRSELEDSVDEAVDRLRGAEHDLEVFEEILGRREAALREARAAYLACVEQCVDEAALGGTELTLEDVLAPGFTPGPAAAPSDADAEPRTPAPRSERPAAPSRPAPAGSKAVVPDVAFAGGTISGMVVDDEGRPVPSVPVEVATISGVVVEARTDPEGGFTAEVPEEAGEPEEEAGDEGSAVRIAVAGVAEEVTARLIDRVGAGIHADPPPFLRPDSKVHVAGDYTEATIESPGTSETGTPSGAGPAGETPPTADPPPSEPGVADPPAEPPERGRLASEGGAPGPYDPRRLAANGRLPLAVARAVGPGGAPVVTAIRIPAELVPSKNVLVLKDRDGVVRRFPTRFYRAQGWIDQETLNTGSETRFGLNFEFGADDPPETVRLQLDVTGPIEVEGAGRFVELPVDAAGRASYEGTLTAERGSLTGVPFSITPTIRQ